MIPQVRRERAREVEDHHLLAAAGVAIGAIALADLRAAGLALVVVLPLLVLSRRGSAAFSTSLVSVDPVNALAQDLQRAGSIALVEAEGPLLFLSVPHIDRLLREHQPWPNYVILDLRAASALDASALAALRDLLHQLRRNYGEFLLVSTPGSSVNRVLHQSGLVAQALGGTTCFRVERALERIAARHPAACEAEDAAVAQRPRLYLVHSAARRGD
ncbi:MAG TPA: STAS domain-containing protein [Polyangiales bacterium]